MFIRLALTLFAAIYVMSAYDSTPAMARDTITLTPEKILKSVNEYNGIWCTRNSEYVDMGSKDKPFQAKFVQYYTSRSGKNWLLLNDKENKKVIWILGDSTECKYDESSFIIEHPEPNEARYEIVPDGSLTGPYGWKDGTTLYDLGHLSCKALDIRYSVTFDEYGYWYLRGGIATASLPYRQLLFYGVARIADNDKEYKRVMFRVGRGAACLIDHAELVKLDMPELQETDCQVGDYVWPAYYESRICGLDDLQWVYYITSENDIARLKGGVFDLFDDKCVSIPEGARTSEKNVLRFKIPYENYGMQIIKIERVSDENYHKGSDFSVMEFKVVKDLGPPFDPNDLRECYSNSD